MLKDSALDTTDVAAVNMLTKAIGKKIDAIGIAIISLSQTLRRPLSLGEQVHAVHECASEMLKWAENLPDTGKILAGIAITHYAKKSEQTFAQEIIERDLPRNVVAAEAKAWTETKKEWENAGLSLFIRGASKIDPEALDAICDQFARIIPAQSSIGKRIKADRLER